MEQQQDQPIWLLTDVELPVVDEGSKFGGSHRNTENLTERVLVSLDLPVLRDQLTQFVQQINSVFGQLDNEHDGNFHLDEIEMSVKITAEGQIVLFGSGGKVGGEGGLTLRLIRR